MAGWKDTNISNPGTSIKYGADDNEMIMRMFNGVTTGINSVEIKSTNKWGFWDNIMYVRNQADTKNTTIRGQSNSPSSDVTLALPPIVANDTLTALGITNIFSTKQEFDDGVLLKQQSAPSNPASTFHHFYTASNGHLIRRNSSGVEVDYDSVTAGLPTGLNKYIQYNNAGVFGSEAGFEYDQSVNEATIPGLTVTENLILNGVISPSQITASQNNYNPTGLATASTLRLTSDAARDITGITAQPSGTMLFIHNVGSFNIVLKDESGSSTTTNRFAMIGDVTLAPDNSACIKYDGTTGRWRLVSTDSASSGVALLASANIFTEPQTIKKNTGELLKLFRDISTDFSELSLGFAAKDDILDETLYVSLAAEIQDNTNGTEDGTFSVDTLVAGVSQRCLSVNWENDGGLHCGGPNRRIKFLETGLTAIRTYTFPNITTTLAGLASAQTFTAEQEISSNANYILRLTRDSTAGAIDVGGMEFKSKDSAGTMKVFGDFYMYKNDASTGSEDSNFGLSTFLNGVYHTRHWFSPQAIGSLGGDDSTIWHYQKTNNVLESDKIQYWSNATAYIPCYPSSTGSTTTVISNSSAEQTVLSYTSPIRAMNQNGFMRMTIHGYILQNQATGTVFTFRAKFGGTTMWQDDSVSLAQNATKLPFTIIVTVYAKNSETAQGMSGQIFMNDTTAATTGIGDISDDEGSVLGMFDSEGADTTKDTTAGTQSFSLTAQSSVASASVTLVRKHADVLLVSAG